MLDQVTAPPRKSSVKELFAGVFDYRKLFSTQDFSEVNLRKSQYADMTNQFYDLVTDFYEYGWGPAFHFASRKREESFRESLVRYEIYLALRMGVKPGHQLLDVGCGIGGPMRTIAQFTGAKVVGLNNCRKQLQRAQVYNQRLGLERQCRLVHGDFMYMPFDDNSFDGIYQIGATCHAPDREQVFAQIFRVLRPGSYFCGYEWVLTNRYNSQKSEHQQIKQAIEEGNSLPELSSWEDVDGALRAVGFELHESRDCADESDPETPWYRALTSQDLSLRSIPRTPVGRVITTGALKMLEVVHLMPKGATEVSRLLNLAADALVRSGQLGIFTPMYFYLARKPSI